MKDNKIYYGIGAIGLAAFIGIAYHYYRVYKASLSLSVNIKDIGTPNVTASGGELPLIVSINNPSNKEIRIGYPVIQLLFKDGTQILKTLPKNEIITIKASGETSLPITVKITTQDLLLASVAKLLPAIKNKFKGEVINMNVFTWIKLFGLIKFDIQFTALEKRF